MGSRESWISVCTGDIYSSSAAAEASLTDNIIHEEKRVDIEGITPPLMELKDCAALDRPSTFRSS